MAYRLGCGLSLLAVLALTGCAIKRNGYEVPEVPVPAAYRAETPASSEESLTTMPAAEWWRAFGSAELSALIDRGIAHNADIRIATLKLAQVRERARQAGADKAPSVTAGLGESLQSQGGTVGSVPVTADSSKTTQRLYQASVRATWRVDLWGEQAALAQSADFQVWQAAFERDNVQRNMVASLAASYVEYLALNDRLRIAQEAEKLLNNVLVTIEKRVAADDATLVDLEQQKAAILAVRATIPTLEQQRDDAMTSIAFLTGTLPESLSLSRNGLDSLSQPVLTAQLPSSLIFRRPDVRVIEARLLAADADVDVARARLLPPLDLSAQMGYSSLVLSGLFKPIGFFWNTIANLTVSIFDSGKLASQEAQARAAHEEMIETYARALHQAVRDVERALSVIRTTGKRLDIQQQATAAAKRAWEISHEIYAVGGIDHQTLLDAGRSYLRHLDDTQIHRMERFRGYISLSQALGGGSHFQQAQQTSATATASASPTPLSSPAASATDGTAWPANKPADDSADFHWQVELPGLYPRAAVAPAWRDLRTRFPQLMEGRFLRPRLAGRDSGDSAPAVASTYRLYVARFGTPSEAQTLCAALIASNQRCRVVSSRMDVHPMPPAPTVTPPAAAPTEPTEPAVRPVAQAEVKVEPQPAPPMPPTPPVSAAPAEAPAEPVPAGKEKHPWAVQLGVFANRDNANQLMTLWYGRGQALTVTEIRSAEKGALFAVRSGAFRRREEADALAQKLRRIEGTEAIRVKLE